MRSGLYKIPSPALTALSPYPRFPPFLLYLIIDRDGEEEMVYFLTEITENDLLNATSDNSETLPKNSAALESAIRLCNTRFLCYH